MYYTSVLIYITLSPYQGNDGPAGAKGMTGDAGANGVTGQKGETGARGPTGAQVRIYVVFISTHTYTYICIH